MMVDTFRYGNIFFTIVRTTNDVLNIIQSVNKIWFYHSWPEKL
jgi:hypothetical protein